VLLGEGIMVGNNGSISLKLLESNAEIQKKIYKAFAQDINKGIAKNTQQVTKRLKRSVRLWVQQQPEVSSLTAQGFGSLNAHFGLLPGQAELAVQSIVSAVSDSLRVTINTKKNNLKGTVEIRAQSTNFLNILDLAIGHVTTEKGLDLHWLDWLIIKGDTVIVTDWHYKPGNAGRSGAGAMRIGGVWRVPPEHSGTIGNNFITRSFNGRQKELEEILKGLFA
jgi:hypothetical protein